MASNTVTTSFDTVTGRMTEMSQRKKAGTNMSFSAKRVSALKRMFCWNLCTPNIHDFRTEWKRSTEFECDNRGASLRYRRQCSISET